MKYYIDPNKQIFGIEDDEQIPADCTELTEAQVVEMTAPPETKESVTKQKSIPVQAGLDNFARTRSYDSIAVACSYANSKIPQYQLEGTYCVDLRDDTWDAFYTYLDPMTMTQIKALTEEQIFAKLPVPAWPEAV